MDVLPDRWRQWNRARKGEAWWGRRERTKQGEREKFSSLASSRVARLLLLCIGMYLIVVRFAQCRTLLTGVIKSLSEVMSKQAFTVNRLSPLSLKLSFLIPLSSHSSSFSLEDRIKTNNHDNMNFLNHDPPDLVLMLVNIIFIVLYDCSMTFSLLPSL